MVRCRLSGYAILTNQLSSRKCLTGYRRYWRVCQTPGKSAHQTSFCGKLVCGDCGSFYGHKVWRLRSTGERYNVWYCNHKYDGDKTCDSPELRDEEIKAAFEKMLQKCSDANLSIPMRDGISWWNPSRSAGAAT